MHISIPVSQADLTRQERLLLWIWRSPYSKAEISRKLEVSACTFGKWVRAERLPVRSVNLMRSFGIPEELLPRAEDLKPGRQRRVQNRGCVMNNSIRTPPASTSRVTSITRLSQKKRCRLHMDDGHSLDMSSVEIQRCDIRVGDTVEYSPDGRFPCHVLLWMRPPEAIPFSA